MEQRNIKLTLAYDGTNFSGFQRQKNTGRTIQEILEQALSKLTGEKIVLVGAGRTDAGVHALGQVVNFKTYSRIPTDRWCYALRGLLPKEIVVYQAQEVPSEFNARYSAVSKTYVYRIWRGKWPNIFRQRFTLHYPGPLDQEAIQSVVPYFLGTHDFAAFASKGSNIRRTVRTVSRMELETGENEWALWIKADGFLYHMVRNIVGTLLWIGEGKIKPALVRDVLQKGERTANLGPTAPSTGLCLVTVDYGEELESGAPVF